MTKLEVYRLALQTVERELDFWSVQIKARPYLKESLIMQYDEWTERKKELVHSIDLIANGDNPLENKKCPERRSSSKEV